MKTGTYVYHIEYKNHLGKVLPPPKALVQKGNELLKGIRFIENLNIWKDSDSHGRDKIDKYLSEGIINNEQHALLLDKDNILKGLRGESDRITLDRIYEWELETGREDDMDAKKILERYKKKYFLKLGIDYKLDKKVTIGIVILFKWDGRAVLKTIYVNELGRKIVKKLQFEKYNNPELFKKEIVNEIMM